MQKHFDKQRIQDERAHMGMPRPSKNDPDAKIMDCDLHGIYHGQQRASCYSERGRRRFVRKSDLPILLLDQFPPIALSPFLQSAFI